MVLDVDIQGVQQLKAISGFEARYVFITPPSLGLLAARLRTPLDLEPAGNYEALRQSMMELGNSGVPREVMEAELGYARVPGFYDLVLSSENLDETTRVLANYICSSNQPYQ